jgi:excisionase family DNA binding protein
MHLIRLAKEAAKKDSRSRVAADRQRRSPALATPRKKWMMTVDEAAERLSVDGQTVRNLIDEGKLHAIDVGGGCERKFWRIPLTAIERLERMRNLE